MKKFKYKFERLLDIRKYQEREAQFHFASVLSNYMGTKDKIDSSNELRSKYLIESRNQVNDLNINYLINREKARLGLSNKIKINKNILKEQQFIVEREREKLVEASKKKKTLEILKEKEFERYREETNKIESDELDEIGSNIYLKNKVEF